jgi:hypothetical protein
MTHTYQVSFTLWPERGDGDIGRDASSQGADVPAFEDCLRQVMAIQGALRASLIDHSSGMTVAAAGRDGPAGDGTDHPEPNGAETGPMGIVRATVGSTAFVAPATPGYVEDIVITAANGYHLIHFVVPAFDGRLVLYVWLDRLIGNLAMTQRSLHSIGRHLVAA